MPTYNDILQQTQVPVFAELYDITFPIFELNLTPYPQEIKYNFKTYIPCVMERSEINKEKDSGITVTIAFATKENVSLYFLNQNVPQIKIKIIRYFIEAKIAKVIFVGEGDIVGINDRILSLKATDILSLNKKTIPPLVYSSYCNNTLYDKRCGLNAIDYRHTIQVVVDDNKSILLNSAFNSFPKNYFVNGYVEYRGEYRMITGHDNVNGKIYIHAPFDQDINGKYVYVYAGCDKTPQTCLNRFNNLKNFLGFPYIPSKNPAIWGF